MKNWHLSPKKIGGTGEFNIVNIIGTVYNNDRREEVFCRTWIMISGVLLWQN